MNLQGNIRTQQLTIAALEDQNVSILTILNNVQRSTNCHELNSSRCINGEYWILFPSLKKYPDKFIQYMRMKVSTFEYILCKIKVLLVKDWCNLHTQPIMPEERLVLTLRFLATGNTYLQLAFSFKMGVKTVSSIILETMNAVWTSFVHVHMAVPSANDFLNISQDFYTKWGMPHCLGAIDGRHIAIKKPPKSGSLYYNYKGYFSIVLQAVVDANYRYIFIDVGGYGSQHDSATFKSSKLYKALIQNKLNIPTVSKVDHSNLYLPYFFVGDGAYPISEMLMKPYSGTELLHDQKVFNKQLSRARVVVENAFGRTSQKWRILYSTIDKSPKVINVIIKCTCLLHNIVIDVERSREMDDASFNAQQTINVNDNDDDVMIAPTTGQDIRNELAKYFKKNRSSESPYLD